VRPSKLDSISIAYGEAERSSKGKSFVQLTDPNLNLALRREHRSDERTL
jgi:hypothetical protein